MSSDWSVDLFDYFCSVIVARAPLTRLILCVCVLQRVVVAAVVVQASYVYDAAAVAAAAVRVGHVLARAVPLCGA